MVANPTQDFFVRMRFKRVCVFCGSGNGLRPEYRKSAERLGQLLAERSMELVYGGAKVGLMGAVADAVLASGGAAIGVIPGHLIKQEIAHEGLTELHTVTSMHERKALMAELADAFVALPGGLGTLEELFEMVTWNQIGLQQKPCGLLNVSGYYDPLEQFLQQAEREQFIRNMSAAKLVVEAEPEALLKLLESAPLF